MKNNLIDFISLHKGEEVKEKVLIDVKDNISFRNANLWILACAILIASIGLNVNSTAVIIGAMLISPLMGPIVGAGFALATYDFEILKKAGRSLLIATVVSLLVAALYFFISPFKETQSELLARTSPNIYDVMIAFLGGLVGVISLTRANKGNPIPGVAIATALMPPLCTAGYGLAIGNLSYFFGAFYLYAINCFFICIATFFITRYLKYPPVQTIDKKHDLRIKRGISVMILIMIIPSFFLAFNLYNEKKFTQKVYQFIDNEFTSMGYTIVFQKVRFNENPRKLELAFLSKRFSEEEIHHLNDKLEKIGAQNTQLVIRQDSMDLKGEILKELSGQDKIVNEKDIEIIRLKNELDKYKIDLNGTDKEIRILFPEIEKFSIGHHTLANDSTGNLIIFLYSLQKEKDIDSVKLSGWLQQKFNTINLKVLEERM